MIHFLFENINTFNYYDIINNIYNYILYNVNEALKKGIWNIFLKIDINNLLTLKILFKKKNNIYLMY